MAWGTPTSWVDISNSNALAVADGSGAISAEVDNSSDKHVFGDVEVTLDSSATSSGLDARIDVYLVPIGSDGTTYPTPGGASTYTDSQYVGKISSVETVGTVAATSYQHGMLRRVPLPPSKFKFGFVNELGVTLVGKTVTVKERRYSPA